MLVTQLFSSLRRRPTLRPVRPDVFTSPHISDAHRHPRLPQASRQALFVKQESWRQKKARPGGRAVFLSILIISIVPTPPDTLCHNIYASETITYMKKCDFYLLTEISREIAAVTPYFSWISKDNFRN
jgi:hypothetical protein